MKNTKKILILMMILMGSFFIPSLKVKAVTNTETEYVYDESGGTVNYYGTDTPVEIPTDYTEKTSEMRAVWVSFFAGDLDAYTSESQMKAQLNEVLDTMEEYHMNAIVFHIRTHNDALYDTDMDIPTSSYVASADFSEWDYLEWFINECHTRGIEFHAWLNPYRLYMNGSGNAASLAAQVALKYADYPTNPAHNPDNVLCNDDGSAILDPGIPEVQDYIVDVCDEIMNKYDVDAIHFDDYFYVSGVDDSETYQTYGTSQGLANFRRASVDAFIEKLSASMNIFNTENNKAVQLGISPSGIYQNGTYTDPSDYVYNDDGTLHSPLYSGSRGFAHYDYYLYSDTLYWINQGWIDYITPQVYWGISNSAAPYAGIVQWWAMATKNTKTNLYIGIGIYRKDTATDSWGFNDRELVQQIKYASAYPEVDGFCFYDYSSISKTSIRNSSDVAELLDELWTVTPKVPVIPKNVGTTFDAQVSNLKLYEANGIIALSFDKIDDVDKYIIYKYSSDLDLSDSTSIAGLTGNNMNNSLVTFTDTTDIMDYYAVVPLSRSGLMGQATSISVSSATDVDIEIGSTDDIKIGSYVRPNTKVSVSFTDGTSYIGEDFTYKVYASYDEDKNYFLIGETTSYSGQNSIYFTFDETGLPMYVKMEATNSFGTITSNIERVIVTDVSAYNLMQEINDSYKDAINNIIGGNSEE
ncbi:MAG: family 10 glycosylhydrolase [Bacilli bacterium]